MFDEKYNSYYSKSVDIYNVPATLVGHWNDLAAYYKTSNGEYYCWQGRSFVNCGNELKNVRGWWLDGNKI